MRWVLTIKTLRGLVKKGIFEGEVKQNYVDYGTMHTMKKGQFIFTLTFWLKCFPLQNTNIKYSYYTVIME